MSSRGTSYLMPGGILNPGDYLVSDNGIFFAIMQSDGTIAIYRGTGPNDNHGQIWGSPGAPGGYLDCFAIMQSDGTIAIYRGTGPNDKHGQIWGSPGAPGGYLDCFIILENDGSFSTYRGTGPNDKHGQLWHTKLNDPVVDIPTILGIKYDVENGKILQSGLTELYRQTVVNQDDINQTSSILGNESTMETSGWSDALAVKVGASTTFVTGIPRIFEGKITVSVDVTNTYTWNGSTSTTKSWGFNSPVNVPPHSTRIVLVAVTTSTISVPYILTGNALLKSGIILPIIVHGLYVGTNSHDLQVTIIKMDSVTHKTETIAEKIFNTPLEIKQKII